jgi:glycine/D-amino acid oxidase-like deaminating enzyme/glycine cleavage system aminomethyltransferase T
MARPEPSACAIWLDDYTAIWDLRFNYQELRFEHTTTCPGGITARREAAMKTGNTDDLGDARVVVIGGGIAGCSAAYHLAALGLTDVLLLERASLSSGTTWHSTGSMETYRDNPLIFEMVRYTVNSFPGLQSESGQQLGWRNLGRVMYTDRESRFEVFRTLPELGRARGIEIELLSARGVGERLPIIDPSGLVGGVWIPSDGCVNPTDVVMAYAMAARVRGVRIREQVRIQEIIVKNGAVRGVVTDRGTVGCDTVVVAAGRWSSAITSTCGVRLPLYALEHQYIITEAIPGLDRKLPLLLSYDDQLYGREEVGGLIIGSFDDNAVPVSSPNTTESSAFALLNERWEQFEPYMKTALRRFPVLATAGIKMLLNGPESFTPDGEMLLGPVPGVDGLYSVCGFNSTGIALSPAAGKFIAEWIVEGEASADVAQLDVRRFAPQQTSEAYMRERVTEIPHYACGLHGPTDDYATARNLRLSPIHASLTVAGAHFASVGGWERPTWIETPTARNWINAVAQEVDTAGGGALAVDRSADVKIALFGAAAESWLAAKLGLAGLNLNSFATLVAFPGEEGQVEALGRIVPWRAGWLLTAGPEQETRLTEWVRRARVPDGVHAVDLTAGWAIFELMGSGQARAVQALCASADDGIAVTIDSGDRRWAGAVYLQLFTDPANASTLIFVPADTATYVWRQLLAVGETGLVRIGGHFAMEALRIARGIPRFGQEATPATRVADIVGARQIVAGSKSAAAKPVRRTGRLLVAFSSPPVGSCFGTHEGILKDGRVIGEITSRACLAGWPQTLSLGLLPAECASLASLQLAADGRHWPLSVRSTDWQAEPAAMH